MVQTVYQGFYDDIMGGTVIAASDLRAILVMSNTTTDTEEDAQTMSDFTTIDECDGVGYAEYDVVSHAVAYNSTTDVLAIDGDDGDMDGGGDVIQVSTRDVTGIVFYRYVDGTDANNVPWFSETIGPFTLSGGPFNVVINAAGIATIGSA